MTSQIGVQRLPGDTVSLRSSKARLYGCTGVEQWRIEASERTTARQHNGNTDRPTDRLGVRSFVRPVRARRYSPRRLHAPPRLSAGHRTALQQLSTNWAVRI